MRLFRKGVPMRKALVAGNWKMNGRIAKNDDLVSSVLSGLASGNLDSSVDVMVCPPAIYVGQVRAQAVATRLMVGAQDLCEFEDGAYTGEVSAEMLVDVGCSAVLVGHSERRALFGDTDKRVAAKLSSAVAAGLAPILCVGESLEQRDSGDTLAVVEQQLLSALSGLSPEALDLLVVAYEPVWAIGTGRTATPEQAQDVHAHIRQVLATIDGPLAEKVRLLYGGSVKPANARELFAQKDIDGGLIGGASLNADDFLAICRAAVAG